MLQNTTKRHALAFCYGTGENRGLYVGLYTQSYQIAKDETRSRLNEIKLQWRNIKKEPEQFIMYESTSGVLHSL